jgi:prophage regulatory protein
MPAPDRLLRLRDVAFLVGMSKATIYRKLKVGDFPRPVSAGASVRWKESDIAVWIASLTTRAE